ncbi:MAG: BON domain-containing protein [Verrucomicrobiota bacterium]
MKKSVFIFVVGLALGALGWHFYQRKFPPTMGQRAGDMAERTREAAAGAKEQAASSARELGEDLSDAGIIARIKGKYLVERDISALAISVECTNGHVTLNGVVKTPELIERAGRIARETSGVSGVTVNLIVKK